MISGATSCFNNGTQGLQIYGVSDHQHLHHHHDMVSSSLEANSAATAAAAATAHCGSFIYNLSILKDKVHQVQSLANIFISSDHSQQPESTAIAVASMCTLIQEIIVTSSSMMFACQQMSLGSTPISNNNNNNAPELHPHRIKVHPDSPIHLQNCDTNQVSGSASTQQVFFSNDHLDWYEDNYASCNTDENNARSTNNNIPGMSLNAEMASKRDQKLPSKCKNNEGLFCELSPKNYDIVELDAADLLAKYTHYCQVCGKGFKRDANLRMHMRAHGDEYKSSAALSNPMKNMTSVGGKDEEGFPKLPRKYSCPQEGCRWNKKHAKFQPLKSMICVKNHYKRSHCPKMYVCKRCNRKQFSVLSDLRTHEKHCGDLKWQCSCGTTFSRKDKLMGHVALFAGHTPAINSLAKMGKGSDQSSSQVQLEDR